MNRGKLNFLIILPGQGNYSTEWLVAKKGEDGKKPIAKRASVGNHKLS